MFVPYGLFTCIVFILWCYLFHTTANLPDPAEKFRASLCFFSRILWRLGLWFIVFYCEQNCFQSNLNPKEFLSLFLFFFLFCFFFSCPVFSLLAVVLHGLKIPVVCCLWFQFIAGIFVHWLGVTFLRVCPEGVCDSRTNRNSNERKRIGTLFAVWLIAFFFFFFFFLWLSCLLVSLFVFHREVWNVQYCILQSMQAKNCGTLFYVLGNL